MAQAAHQEPLKLEALVSLIPEALKEAKALLGEIEQLQGKIKALRGQVEADEEVALKAREATRVAREAHNQALDEMEREKARKEGIITTLNGQIEALGEVKEEHVIELGKLDKKIETTKEDLVKAKNASAKFKHEADELIIKKKEELETVKFDLLTATDKAEKMNTYTLPELNDKAEKVRKMIEELERQAGEAQDQFTEDETERVKTIRALDIKIGDKEALSEAMDREHAAREKDLKGREEAVVLKDSALNKDRLELESEKKMWQRQKAMM